MWETSGREMIPAFAAMEGKIFSSVSGLLASIVFIGKCLPIFVGLLRNREHLALGSQKLFIFKVKSCKNFGGWEWKRKCHKKMKAA